MPRPTELRTNHDLYLFVVDLCETNEESTRSLEDYLKTLWRLASPHEAIDALPSPVFAGLLEAAFHEDVPPFDTGWWFDTENGGADEWGGGHVRWNQTILEQIVDLRAMEEVGTLANEHRHFGVAAPRGSSWYNFDPLTFLERAAAGTFGDPEIDESVVDVETISWDLFADFLRRGQLYE